MDHKPTQHRGFMLYARKQQGSYNVCEIYSIVAPPELRQVWKYTTMITGDGIAEAKNKAKALINKFLDK